MCLLDFYIANISYNIAKIQWPFWDIQILMAVLLYEITKSKYQNIYFFIDI